MAPAVRGYVLQNGYLYFITFQDGFWKEVLTDQKVTHFPTVYEAVFITASSYGEGPGDESFREQVYRRLRELPFHSPISTEEEVSRYSAYLCDAVLLYAQTVKEMIKAGRDFRDWRQLVLTLKGSNQTAFRGKWFDDGTMSSALGLVMLPRTTESRPVLQLAQRGTPVSTENSSRSASGMISGDLSSFVKSQQREELFHAPLGLYQGNRVAICYVGDQAEAWVRKPSVRQEILLMCELRHENIVPFFGVYVEPPNICIVTEYCKKGSLKLSKIDVLRNSDNEMDWIFKLSFAYARVNVSIA
ncbi:Guanylate cyclase 2G [Camelus dromedarius]|uniref:guanylate cyclase n=1 Tax=Camelus dromedarius TaxID=9838 RepID=A0A5N4DK08_CAMDR|nr:Guanylate cyclase 2G [Camelus dromedarius]